MGRQISELIAELDEKVLKLRRIRRMLESEAFFATQSTLDLAEVDRLVQAGDAESLRAMIRKEVKTELGSMTLRQLRKMARGRQIRGYHLLPKPILLSELSKHASVG